MVVRRLYTCLNLCSKFKRSLSYRFRASASAIIFDYEHIHTDTYTDIRNGLVPVPDLPKLSHLILRMKHNLIKRPYQQLIALVSFPHAKPTQTMLNLPEVLVLRDRLSDGDELYLLADGIQLGAGTPHLTMFAFVWRALDPVLLSDHLPARRGKQE